ncbi:hypothetical protein Bca52824_054829 [Brassica carinata]|uniref:Uncharacterized protein n=1 Tax=Brassica carinata TaxID=52824 RepID=A0A8X7R6W3_BRACI|nr:hypothetical protein Bca52824_054829 [Brassica carinata]
MPVPSKLAQKIKKFVKRRYGKTLQPTREEDVVKEEHWYRNVFAFEEGSSRSKCWSSLISVSFSYLTSTMSEESS